MMDFAQLNLTLVICLVSTFCATSFGSEGDSYNAVGSIDSGLPASGSKLIREKRQTRRHICIWIGKLAICRHRPRPSSSEEADPEGGPDPEPDPEGDGPFPEPEPRRRISTVFTQPFPTTGRPVPTIPRTGGSSVGPPSGRKTSALPTNWGPRPRSSPARTMVTSLVPKRILIPITSTVAVPKGPRTSPGRDPRIVTPPHFPQTIFTQPTLPASVSTHSAAGTPPRRVVTPSKTDPPIIPSFTHPTKPPPYVPPKLTTQKRMTKPTLPPFVSRGQTRSPGPASTINPKVTPDLTTSKTTSPVPERLQDGMVNLVLYIVPGVGVVLILIIIMLGICIHRFVGAKKKKVPTATLR